MLADCMSSLPNNKLPTIRIDLSILSINCITHHVKATDLQSMRIKESTTKDDVLSLLKHIIQNVWPQTVKKLPEEIQHY